MCYYMSSDSFPFDVSDAVAEAVVRDMQAQGFNVEFGDSMNVGAEPPDERAMMASYERVCREAE